MAGHGGYGGHRGGGMRGGHRGLGLFGLLLVPSAGGALLFLGLGAGIIMDMDKHPLWWLSRLWLPGLLFIWAIVEHHRGKAKEVDHANETTDQFLARLGLRIGKNDGD